MLSWIFAMLSALGVILGDLMGIITSFGVWLAELFAILAPYIAGGGIIAWILGFIGVATIPVWVYVVLGAAAVLAPIGLVAIIVWLIHLFKGKKV